MAISDTKYLNNLSAKVQEGCVYTGFVNVDSVANNETVYIKITSGAKYAHFIIDIKTVGQWNFSSWIDSTYTDNGTTVGFIPRKTDANNMILTTVHEDPTIDVLGTQRFNFTFGAETSFFSASNSEFIDGLESILEPNKDLLLGLTNTSGSTQYISVILNGYETAE